MEINKILITGATGFVSRYFVEYCKFNYPNIQLMGLDIKDAEWYKHYNNFTYENVDLLSKNEVKNILEKYNPDAILHLAALSSVAYSWKHPAESFLNNTNIFLNLLEGVRDAKLSPRILSVGSSEEYGNVDKDKLPLKEDSDLSPNSPYAVARVSQEMLSKLFIDNYKMDIVLTRSFNHIGPHQDTRFVIPSFVRQIRGIATKDSPNNIIRTGNIDVIRDFVDVRDVVEAYFMLFLYGKKGETYNICSGEGKSLKEIIKIISQICHVDVTCQVDKSLIRPSENLIIIGDNTKIKKETGWKPKIPLYTTIKDMIKEDSCNDKNYGNVLTAISPNTRK